MASVRVNKIILVISVLWLLAAFAGLITYATFFHNEGPIYDYPMAQGMLLCATLIICVFQSFSLFGDLKRVAAGEPKRFVNSNLVYFGLMTLFAFTFFIGSCIGQPWMPIDGVFWSLVLIIVNATNVCILFLTKREASSLMSTSEIRLQTKEEADQLSNDSSSTNRDILLRCASYLGFATNNILKGITFLYFGLMLGGCWIQGLGFARHGSSPPGPFVTVTHRLGTQTFHIWCDGPTDPSKPVVWIETGGGHSMYDLIGLHLGVIAGGYRSCINDKPGMGLTDYRFPGQQYEDYYEELLQTTGETWGYTLEYRSNISAIVLMDVVQSDFEYDSLQFVYNLTDEEVQHCKDADFASRVFLHDIIRVMGVQWGIMSFLFVPSDQDSYIPLEYYDAFAFINGYNEKSWTYQYFGLVDYFTKPTVNFRNNTISRDTPLFVMASKTNGTAQCIRNNQPLGSQECADTIRSAEYNFETKLQTTTFTDDSEMAVCMNCNLGFPVNQPQWTIDNIVSYLDKISQRKR